jgi:SAM-dependent methyltransferase
MPEPSRPRGFLEIAPVDVPLRAGDALARSLAALRAVHNYNEWVYRTCRPFIGRRIVEVGAGLGSITQFLLAAEMVVCLEPFDPFRDYLARSLAGHPHVRVRAERIEDCPNEAVPAGAFDTVLCINVLEHILDDVAALKRMGPLLGPGGRVVVLVPALPGIAGRMDSAVGHHRRYTRRSLAGSFREAGLTVRRSGYMNLVGVLGWWWYGRVLKRQHIHESTARRFDRMVPVLSAVEAVLPPPVGQSLYMVGSADDNKAG